MSYQNPVGQPQDPYDKYRVERIEADKKTKDEEKKKEEKPAPGNPMAASAYLLLLFHRFLDLFEDTSEKGIASTAEKEVRDNLILVKEALEILKKEDRSQDAIFLNGLSELWHKALQDIMRFRRETPLARQFKSLIKDIDSYPENQEFSLGYYLTEYAGQKWLPFPYMELVMKIHADHEKNPESSVLTEWTTLIDSLVKKMES